MYTLLIKFYNIRKKVFTFCIVIIFICKKTKTFYILPIMMLLKPPGTFILKFPVKLLFALLHAFSMEISHHPLDKVVTILQTITILDSHPPFLGPRIGNPMIYLKIFPSYRQFSCCIYCETT